MMLGLRNVIAVIDPYQENDHLMDKVRALAHLEDFDLHLVSADYTQYLVEGYYFDGAELARLRDEFLSERRTILEELAAPLREGGLTVTTSAHWGHPTYRVILDAVAERSADLVIQATRRHTAMSRLFLTNDDWQLVRACPAPLLLVKEKPWKEAPVLLCAVDPFHRRSKPTGLDHKILRTAEAVRATLGAGDIYAMHSYNEKPLSGTYPAAALEKHKAAFDELMADFELPDEQQILMAETPDLSLQMLERDLQADIVIMGAISRSVIADVLIGNTADRVLDYIECDVLIIKPDGFESPG